MIVKTGNEILREQYAGELSADEKWIRLSDFEMAKKRFFYKLEDLNDGAWLKLMGNAVQVFTFFFVWVIGASIGYYAEQKIRRTK